MEEARSVQEIIAGFRRALRVKELADILCLTPSMLYKKARDGDIPSFRVGTSVRFDPKQINEWLRMH